MIAAKRDFLKAVTPVLLLLLLIAGCDSSECEQSGLPMVQFNFYDMDKNDLTPTSDAPLTVTAGGTDSVLINLSTSNYFRVPLNYTNDSTVFYLYFQSSADPGTDAPADTIILYYENKPFFISMECGTAVFQDLESVKYTTNQFDSIAIIDRNVTKDETSHIHIFVNQ
ncbi:MAG: DUF6452 family protein [Bacteroides sp.]|nr:DUF6452 family protein [Bacteroides sp.]